MVVVVLIIGLVKMSTTPLTDEQFKECTDLLVRILFPNDWCFSKVMWRMSGGSRSKALNIAKETLKHYSFPQDMSEQDFADVFDQACADVNGGLEMEWETE